MSSASEALRGAVEAEVRTVARPGMIVTDIVVIAAATGYDADGEQVTGVYIVPDASEHAMLGLLDHARIRVQASILDDYDGEV